MIFTKFAFDAVVKIDLENRTDSRGMFSRLFCMDEFEKNGLNTAWKQINRSTSYKIGTVRGLHFQRKPMMEIKLVRCVRGAIFDVIVDLRNGSKTYGAWTSIMLNDQNNSMIYIPEGFAHGFQTLESDSELLYMHSETYSPDLEGGVYFNDPDLSIPWPITPQVVSCKDKTLPRLNEIVPL